MKHILQQLSEGKSLSSDEINRASESLFSKEITDSEIAAFLIGLKMKGETAEEIAGIAAALRERSLKFDKRIPDIMDNCGTGGDGVKSFNISTTSAFVIAGAGIPVAKHGNRSISSKTGSADVLEQLGIDLASTPEVTEETLEKVGIAFLYAPHVHPQLKKIMKVRKDLRIPTIFNLIGPLTNPVELETQLLGIYRRDIVVLFAEVLKKLGRKRAIVINGAGYMDEASLQGENFLAILENGLITEKVLHPEEFGLSIYSNDSVRGGDAKENADILLRVLKGKKGPYRETVLLNAGIGIFTAGKAKSIHKGIELAKESIDSGTALNKLQQLITESQKNQKQVI
ncbi:anthranilate phosphoribosyltransferase [Cytobacillus solani]|uniref:Anthranilate phosphoribosyltransferase n=1 Tax=Cytobacillus solani TaxID=1637975 RepID=A0A0Q3T9E3_9BACI|nr:anthranilate phosphoribosyltransferase [Cytobacillus solani]KOP82973.1 anthranilate phosphoribosyltransferase [Bacillus sp. FJAT-21945]KQL19997.1 anthranilate phosphoribosyltransferase [Cytobacillus solani]USK53241.1 anthranilate phosphoribosyltransferase [Cytobacillus solani]